MKKVIIAAAVLAALSTAAQAQTLRIGTEGEYPPWNFVNDAGELVGFEMDLAKAICEEAALECEIIKNDWDTIIPNLVAGNYDAIMAGMSVTEERQQSIDFTQDYYPPDPSRYIGAAGAVANFEGNPTGLRIGVQSNTMQAGYAKEFLAADNTILSFASFEQSIADLAAGNVDVVLADGHTLQPVKDNSQGALDFIGPEVPVGGGVAIGLRKGDAELMTKLNDALTALKANGTVDALRAEWFDGVAPAYTE